MKCLKLFIIKNLFGIQIFFQGANAPPRASKLTRERFSIFVANGDNSEDVPFPNIAVSGLAQSSESEIKAWVRIYFVGFYVVKRLELSQDQTHQWENFLSKLILHKKN